MARNSSGPSGLGRLGTWRSGGESPSFPGSGDARRLLEAVDLQRPVAGCTLVRVRLGDSDRRTLVRVRDRLLGAEHIVATSIGRQAGPDDQGAFDILVVPDYDPVTVGREISDVDDVVGVAATSFEGPEREQRPTEAVDPERSAVSGSTDDDAATALRTSVRAGTDEPSGDDPAGPAIPGGDDVDLPGVLASGDDGSDAADDARVSRPDVGGLDALEGSTDDPAANGRPPGGDGTRGGPTAPDDAADRQTSGREVGKGRRGVTDALPADGLRGDRSTSGPRPTVGEEGPPPDVDRDGIGDRLDRLDGRLSELEAAVDVDDGGATPTSEQANDEGTPTTAELADRIAALEAAVVHLERRERRLRDAIRGDSG